MPEPDRTEVFHTPPGQELLADLFLPPAGGGNGAAIVFPVGNYSSNWSCP